jgi:hypothetical protein
VSDSSAINGTDSLNSALESVQGVSRREDAVSALIALLKDGETTTAIALLWGFSQSVRLYQDDAPLERPYWQQQYAEGRTDPRAHDFETLAQAAISPAASTLVKAHIGNLVLSYRTNQTEIGAGSVDAYLNLASDSQLDRIEQYSLAANAFDVARRLGDETRTDAARARLLTIVDEALAATTPEHPEGGTILRALEYFVFCGGTKGEADARLRRALPLFEDDWHLRRVLAIFLSSLQPTKEESDGILSEHLRALITQATTRDGFMKEALLRQVLATARAQGLRDVAGVASSALAQIRPEDYDFKVSEFSWKLDEETRDQVKQFLELLRSAPPDEAWALWASKTPTFLPSTERPPYEFSVSDRIATLTEINRAGHVSFQAGSDGEIVRYHHHKEDRRLYEYQFQLVIGPGLPILLSRPECIAALTNRLERSPLFTEIGAERALRAFTAFLEGDAEPAGNVLPTIEAAIRVLAVQAQVSIYNPAGGANVFKTLGGLIADLIPHLGDAERLGRFWEFALTDQLGFNIRNDYLHGFLEQLTHLDAVVVLQVLGQMIFLFAYQPAQTSADGQSESLPAK